MAVQANAQYQWLDCDNNFAEIEGATDQTFNPTSSGNYAVEVQLENCIDTSECTQIIISGVNELTINQYHIYPVPTKDYVQISSTRSLVNMPYRLYSLEGQLVFSGILADDVRLSLQNYLPGMYLLELDGQVFKLVKM
jgi:hypothetical protein